MNPDVKNSEYLPFLYRDLNNALKLKAKKELNESESNKRKGLSELRKFIKNQNLPSSSDDAFLLQFLRVSKFDIRKSEQRLLSYCDMRSQVKDYIHMLDDQKILSILKSNIAGVLPYRDREGRAIIYLLACAWTPAVCDIEDLTSYLFIVLHFILSFPATTVSGLTFITDSSVEHPSIHFYFINILRKHIMTLMKCPLRFQRIDLNNVNIFCRACYSAFSPFLPQKITKRVHLHGDCGPSIHKHYPPSILPVEFGGTLGPINNDHFRAEFMLFLKQFRQEDSVF